MANVQKLEPYNDLSIIGKYVERFPFAGPDEIFATEAADTVLTFSAMWKEKEEFHDRFRFYFNKLKDPPTKK